MVQRPLPVTEPRIRHNCARDEALRAADRLMERHLFGELSGDRSRIGASAAMRVPSRDARLGEFVVGSSRVDLQACKLEYSIVSPK